MKEEEEEEEEEEETRRKKKKKVWLGLLLESIICVTPSRYKKT